MSDYSEGRWKLSKMDGTRTYRGGDLEIPNPTEADFRGMAKTRLQGMVLNGVVPPGTRVKLECHAGGTIRTVVVAAELPEPKAFSEALDELATRAEDLADEKERGEDFLLDVAGKAVDMAEWVRENGRLTDEQLRAYRNWCTGVDAWDR